jgi:hypothetical protein
MSETNDKKTGAPRSLDGLVGPCPLCGTPNSDDWPIEVAGEIVQGGCQECWEKQSDAAWWKMVVAVDTLTANKRITT